MILLVIACVFFYVTLILELTVWHIPSVASSRNIIANDEEVLNQYSEKYSEIFKWTLVKKITVFVIPLLFIYILHFYPLRIIVDFFKGESFISLIPLGISVTLVLLGRMISLIYIFTLKKLHKNRKYQTKLYTGGIFKLSRNPGLVGLYISFVGFGVAIPNLFYFICFLVYIVHMHFKVVMEEDFLSNKFGKTYVHYLTQSKRYF